MKKFSLLFSVLCLALSVSLAHADTLTFNSSSGEIGPYNLPLNSTPVSLFCMNDQNFIQANESWGVNVVNASTYFGSASGSTGFKYEEEAYLYSQFNGTNATDMGTNDTLPNGSPAPAPTVYDIDGIENPASTVSALHARGAHAVCYIEAGTAGNYYSASDEGIPTTYYAQLQAAGVLGAKLSGYPEYFLDINAPATVSIEEAMIQQQCAAKGFDAVETDLDETYSGTDGATGFNLTQANEVTYLTTLANYMHSLGLAWFIKNPDDTGDNFATIMEPVADAVLTEQCNQYGTCSALNSYKGHKAIFNAEYSMPTSAFCAADIAALIHVQVFGKG